MPPDSCPVCQMPLLSGGKPTHGQGGLWWSCNCPRCGNYLLISPGQNPLGNTLIDRPRRRANLSYIIRRSQRVDGQTVTLHAHEIEKIILDAELPTASEQLDRLILWIGNHQKSPSGGVHASIPEVSAWIGMEITADPTEELGWLLGQVATDSLIAEGPLPSMWEIELQLTFEGWRRFEALRRATVTGHTAFMAMKFGDSELDAVVSDCFKPAVAKTGFELRLLNEGQAAGLIDDQLRVALRTSRFVLADVTHANNGAYWEAGFAEGLGRPVIYTCRKAEWEERKVHFDTNHLVTIIWQADALSDAAERLTATIRATLPGEAKITD